MRYVVRQKFLQHRELQEQLLNTGEEELISTSQEEVGEF